MEKAHKWHRNSLVLGVEFCDDDVPANERFGTNAGDTYDFGVDNVGVACDDFNAKFCKSKSKLKLMVT